MDTDTSAGESAQPGASSRPSFDGKYLSLATFKRDGAAVATPVWFVADNGRLLVLTDAESFKVKRIRRNPDVSVARCSASGRLRGEPVPAGGDLARRRDGPCRAVDEWQVPARSDRDPAALPTGAATARRQGERNERRGGDHTEVSPAQPSRVARARTPPPDARGHRVGYEQLRRSSGRTSADPRACESPAMTDQVVIWDFDGTLALRPGLWGGCVLEVLDELEPGHGVAIEVVREGLRDGFPWHAPDEPHLHLSDSDAWWAPIFELIAVALVPAGVSAAQADRVARGSRTLHRPLAWLAGV